MQEMSTTYRNLLPPQFNTYYALYLEYQNLLEREGESHLDKFKFCLRSDPAIHSKRLLCATKDDVSMITYWFDTTWLKDKLIEEQVLNRKPR